MNRCCFFFIALVVYVGSHGSSGATYELKQGGNTCLIVDTTATLRVAYTDTAGRDAVATMTLDTALSIGGVCGVSAASLNLTFPGFWLDLQFVSTAKQVSLAGLSLSVEVQNGSKFVNPNTTGTWLLSAKPDRALSPDSMYFACQATIRLPLSGSSPSGSELSLLDTRIQAFNLQNDTFSGNFTACAEDEVSSTQAATTDAASTITTKATEPTTTTIAPTTTTSAPSQPPLLNFTVNSATGAPCLRLQLRATFSIRYAVKAGGNDTKKFFLPADTRLAGGDCGNASQSLRLEFLSGWTSEFTFTKLDAGGYALRYLSLAYRLTPDLFPSPAEPGRNLTAIGNQTFFTVASGSDFYACASTQRLALGADVAIDTQDLRAQAFRTSNATDFFYGSAVHCQDDTPIDNVVPIVVGAALAGLVIVVLIAYLIGRRRHSSGGGYQSV